MLYLIGFDWKLLFELVSTSVAVAVNTTPVAFSLNEWTGLKDTGCYKTVSEKASEKVGNYSLSNFNSCECTAEEQRQLSIVHPTVPFRDGYGWTSINGCNIDKDSNLRNSRNLTNLSVIHQLWERPYLTVPYLGRGKSNAVLESQLQQGELANNRKSINPSTEVSYANYTQTPMIPSLKATINNPANLVEGVAAEGC